MHNRIEPHGMRLFANRGYGDPNTLQAKISH